MVSVRYALKFVANAMLAVVYILGALTILFPGSSTIPESFGMVSIGTLLLTTGIFGCPYFEIKRWDE